MRLTLKERVENCHEDAIWTASWTPAETLISGSVDETVKIWAPGDSVESQHTYTGRPLSTPK
jgi:WD repeat-containing protein 61